MSAAAQVRADRDQGRTHSGRSGVRRFAPRFLSGTGADPAQRRLYPQNGMLAHVIGYTGEISEQELDLPEFAKYNQGDMVGKFGIEKQYNDRLMGVDGQRQVVVDNRGQVRQDARRPSRRCRERPATDHRSGSCRRWPNSRWKARTGAVVALDPRTGEVLAMVSRPTFDPEQIRGPHQDQGLAGDRRQSRPPAAESRDSGAVGAGLHVQADRGAGGPGNAARSTSNGHVHCAGGVKLYGHYQRCLGTARARHAVAARRHRAFVRRLLLHAGQQDRHRQSGVLRRSWRASASRPASICRTRRSGLMPSAEWKLRNYRTKWYRRRDPFGGDRPGRTDGDAAAIGARHRRPGGRRQVVQPHMVKKPVDQVKIGRMDTQSGQCKGRYQTGCMGW